MLLAMVLLLAVGVCCCLCCQQVGGPAGLLKVVIVCARDLYDASQQPSQPPEAAAAEASDATPDGLKTKGKSSKPANKLSSYCELRFGPLVLRTPIVHHVGTADATWNWQLSLPLARELDATGPAAAAAGGAVGPGNRVAAGSSPAAAGAAGGGGSRRASVSGSDSSNVVSLLVFDAQTVGQPVLLGKAKVRVGSCMDRVACLVHGHGAVVVDVKESAVSTVHDITQLAKCQSTSVLSALRCDIVNSRHVGCYGSCCLRGRNWPSA